MTHGPTIVYYAEQCLVSTLPEVLETLPSAVNFHALWKCRLFYPESPALMMGLEMRGRDRQCQEKVSGEISELLCLVYVSDVAYDYASTCS